MVLDYFAKNPKIKTFASDGDDWTGVVSFYHEEIHPHDIAAIAGGEGVCMRAGHHCAQPLMTKLLVPATCRVSPYIYNNEQDIFGFSKSLKKPRNYLHTRTDHDQKTDRKLPRCEAH